MKLRTVRHCHISTSLISDEVAKYFKGKVTPEQYEFMVNNVYTIEEGDLVADKYHGCGAGWVEIDEIGEAVDLKYIDPSFAITDDDGSLIAINDRRRWEDYMKHGSEEQTVLCVDISSPLDLEPYILENGNIRLLVNFSSWELVRF